MAPRLPLSAVVITLNEAHNLERCLNSLKWAAEILVVDSGSTDKTLDIAKSHGARVLEHEWLGYGQQKNWAFSQAKYDWILSIDADEEVSHALQSEIEKFVSKLSVESDKQYFGADFPRKTFFLGRWIMHGGWYPNRLVRLVHRKHAKWTEPAVHEQLVLEGEAKHLECDLLHYTFRDIGDQVMTNVRFSRLGAKVAAARGEGGAVWRIFLKPPIKFVECYFLKLGLLDGFPGLVISINAAHSVFMKYVELYFEKNSHHQ